MGFSCGAGKKNGTTASANGSSILSSNMLAFYVHSIFRPFKIGENKKFVDHSVKPFSEVGRKLEWEFSYKIIMVMEHDFTVQHFKSIKNNISEWKKSSDSNKNTRCTLKINDE